VKAAEFQDRAGCSRSDLKLQILLGLSRLGDVRHLEVVSLLSPIQILSLARARLAEFTRVEVWEDSVCVLCLPPRVGRLVGPPAVD
jgi:hypothetical protein